MTLIIRPLRAGRLHPLSIGVMTFAVTVAALLSSSGGALA